MRSWMWIALAAAVLGGAFLWLGGDPTVKRAGPGATAGERADRDETKPKAVSLGDRQAIGPAGLRRATPDAAHLRDLAARQQAMRDKRGEKPADAAQGRPVDGSPTPAAPPPGAPAAPATTP